MQSLGPFKKDLQGSELIIRDSYLRVRYGMLWTDLKDIRQPLRVGDVVILPGELILPLASPCNVKVQGERGQADSLASVTGFSPGVGNFGSQAAWRESPVLAKSCIC